MKKVNLVLIFLFVAVLIVGCSNNAAVNKNADENMTSSFSADNTQSVSENSAEKNTLQAANDEKSEGQTETAENTTNEQKSADEKSSGQSTSKPQPKSDDKKSSGQSTTTTARHTTATKPSTTKKSETTTKKQTTTQKPTTTKKTTTTTTTKKQGLSKSDVEWVQSQGNAYIKSKGLTVDSSVGSFSGRISTKNRTKEQLLDEVKEWIDDEYQECINAGWHSVSMYVKIESRSDGSYFIYVMYG